MFTDDVQPTKRTEEKKDIPTLLSIGLIGAVAVAVQGLGSGYVSFAFYTELEGGTIDWVFWSQVLHLDSVVWFLSSALLMVGFFGLLRWYGSKYSLVYVLVFYSSFLLQNYYRPAYWGNSLLVLFPLIASVPVIIQALILWQVRGSTANRVRLNVLVVLMVLSPVLAHVFGDLLAHSAGYGTLALTFFLYRLPSILMTVFIMVASFVLFSYEKRVVDSG